MRKSTKVCLVIALILLAAALGSGLTQLAGGHASADLIHPMRLMQRSAGPLFLIALILIFRK